MRPTIELTELLRPIYLGPYTELVRYNTPQELTWAEAWPQYLRIEQSDLRHISSDVRIMHLEAVLVKPMALRLEECCPSVPWIEGE